VPIYPKQEQSWFECCLRGVVNLVATVFRMSLHCGQKPQACVPGRYNQLRRHCLPVGGQRKSLHCRYAQPGGKLSIADNNTVCGSYGHFARDCPHRKPNAVAAQNKRNAIWAERNSVQASELQEINKLIKEAERLRAMVDTASIVLAMQKTAGLKTTVVL